MPQYDPNRHIVTMCVREAYRQLGIAYNRDQDAIPDILKALHAAEQALDVLMRKHYIIEGKGGD